MKFISKDIYKKIFLLKKFKRSSFIRKLIYKNSSVIPLIFKNRLFNIYNGRVWSRKYLYKYMIGFKFGEFIWTRKIAIYKKKQKLKKTKK